MTEELKPELLPCPFDEGEAHVVWWIDQCMIECKKCDSTTGYFSEAKNAIKFWNTRTPSKCEHEFVKDSDPLEIYNPQCNHAFKYDKYGRNTGCLICGLIPFNTENE